MKYVSLFAGIGGFDLALYRFGHECVWANEWDKYASQIYEKNFGERPDTRDISVVPLQDIPAHDLLVAGFPCQPFSIAGKRRGFDDTRGTLFFEIARILADKRPRYILLENVRGLLSHESGKTFQTILGVLTDMGYDCQWQVLNSKDFGVPQNRERLFIIGYFRTEPRWQVFPLGKSVKNDINQLNTPTHSNDRVYGVDGISPTLNTAQGGRRQPKIAPTMRANHHNTADVHFIIQPPQRERIYGDNGISPSLIGNNQGGGRSPLISKTVRSGGRKSPHGSKQNWDSYEVNGRIRRLTPLECERLQGFPDGWTEGVSDTQRYKMLGNAVTVNVVEEIIGNWYEIHN